MNFTQKQWLQFAYNFAELKLMEQRIIKFLLSQKANRFVGTYKKLCVQLALNKQGQNGNVRAAMSKLVKLGIVSIHKDEDAIIYTWSLSKEWITNMIALNGGEEI